VGSDLMFNRFHGNKSMIFMLAKIVFNILILSLFVPFMLQAQGHNEFQLSDYRWENRLLLVFAPSQESADHKKQMEELNNRRDGLLDRDLKIIHLFREDASFGDGREIDKETVNGLYQKFDVKPGSYRIILIGKDGTEKLRKSTLLETDELFGLIDSMPMRQREMKQDGK